MFHHYLKLWFLAVAIFVPIVAEAQSPRKVLIEEFTNVGNPEAAAQDSSYLRYIRDSELQYHTVPIIYHTNFPGRDTINTIDSAVHNTRARYYSIAATPQVRVNGRIVTPTGAHAPGSAADTAAIARAVDSIRRTMSPMSITVESGRRGTRIFGRVTVKSSEAVSGARLYVTVMQQSVFINPTSGDDGATFDLVPRMMIPEAYGSELTLAPGEVREIPIEIPIKSGWTAKYIYLAAYVQDTATGEVLQAGHDLMEPLILSSQPNTQIHENVEPIEWTCSLSATVSGRYFYGVYGTLPRGWGAGITIDGTTVMSGDSIELTAGVPRELKISMVPNEISAARKGALIINIKGTRGYDILVPFALYSGRIETIVLLRDYSRQGTLEQYIGALDGLNHPYIFLGDTELDMFDLSKYVLVVAMGQTGFITSELDMLRTVLDKGGRVLLTGAEVAYSLADPDTSLQYYYPEDTAFLHNYLHADYVRDNAESGIIEGVEGDPVGQGIHTWITDGIPNQDTPDEIAPRDGAVPIFHYGAARERVAGIRYADAKNRLIYLGFGIEGIGDIEKRRELLNGGIDWLLGSSGVEEDVREERALGIPYPNPASTICEIPLHLDRASECRVTLHDIRGAEIARLADGAREAGASAIRCDVSQIPSGVYSVRIDIQGRRTSHLFTVVH